MAQIFNAGFRDFVQALNANEVKYIFVGGYAVILHGYKRVTGDIDIWVESTPDNYVRLCKAFHAFGMQVFDMSLKNFLDIERWDVFRFGKKPVAIDIMTKVKGLIFDEVFDLSELLMASPFALFTIIISWRQKHKQEEIKISTI